MTIHYHGSKGAIEIATMPGPYAKNALAKLLRERDGDERQAEVDALQAHVDALDAEHAKALEADQ